MIKPHKIFNSFEEIISFLEENNDDFKNTMYDLYINQFKTYRQLVNILGVNNRTIKKILNYYNIPIRYGSDAIKSQWVNNDKRKKQQSSFLTNLVKGKPSPRRLYLSDIEDKCNISNYTLLKRYKSKKRGGFVYEVKCNNCNKIKTFINSSQLDNKCCITYKGKNINSNGEIKVAEYLINKNFDFEMEVSFRDLYYARKYSYLRFDFGVYKDNNLLFLIEYDGEMHFAKKLGYYEDFEDRVKRDKLKDKYCKDNKIKLIRIPYFYYDNLCEFLDYKIFNLLKK